MTNILLVGCGKMGQALFSRWQDLGLFKAACIVEPAPPPEYKNLSVADFAAIPPSFSPDIVVFAVKPQTLGDIAGGYKKYADQGALAVSIAAGKPLSFFEQHLGAAAKIIRAMPNTPAAIGKGVTVAVANANVKADEKAAAEKLLAAVGAVLWTGNEATLDPVTALSGSGPAYIFLLIEVLTQAGIDIGLEKDMALKLAHATVTGSAALAGQNPDTPASDLRKAVTSPGGTTAAALDVLMASPGGMQELFTKALRAATDRARALSK